MSRQQDVLSLTVNFFYFITVQPHSTKQFLLINKQLISAKFTKNNSKASRECIHRPRQCQRSWCSTHSIFHWNFQWWLS